MVVFLELILQLAELLLVRLQGVFYALQRRFQITSALVGKPVPSCYHKASKIIETY